VTPQPPSLAPMKNGPTESRGSIAQKYIQQRLMNPDAAVALNRSEFAEAVHEGFHTDPGTADHVRQGLL